MALPARIPKNLPKPVKRQREGMSQAHLAFIRTLPCAVCGAIGVTDAHHLLRTVEHSMGKKSSDKWAIPLCSWPNSNYPGCHRALHMAGNEESHLASKGIDGRALAAALWRVSGDRDQALTILYKARNHG